MGPPEERTLYRDPKMCSVRESESRDESQWGIFLQWAGRIEGPGHVGGRRWGPDLWEKGLRETVRGKKFMVQGSK